MDYNVSTMPASQESALATNKVLRNTYMLLSMTLLFSAAMAGLSMAMDVGRINVWLSLGVTLGLLFALHKTAESALGLLFVFAFTGWLGFTLGPILSLYIAAKGGGMVMQALGGTGLIFMGLSAYALTSKKDFSFMGGFLMAGVMVIFFAAIANIFFQSSAVQLAIASVSMLVFSALILFDTSRIIHGGETNYIRATVSLYLNIYNIFLSLLQLLGIFGGDD